MPQGPHWASPSGLNSSPAVGKQRHPRLTTDGGITGVEILSFNFGVTAPHDVATGHTSGKRQHMPIVVTKEWDTTSPRLLAAVASGELVPEVKIDWGDDWLTFTDVKFLNFTRAGGNVESYTFEYGHAKVGCGAAGRADFSVFTFAWLVPLKWSLKP